jgi:hypothetical protein
LPGFRLFIEDKEKGLLLARDCFSKKRNNAIPYYPVFFCSAIIIMSAALALDDNNTKRSSTVRSSMARGTKGFEGFKGGVKGTIKGATALPGGAIKGVGNAAQVGSSQQVPLYLEDIIIVMVSSHSSFYYLSYSLQEKPPPLWPKEPPRVPHKLPRCVRSNRRKHD